MKIMYKYLLLYTLLLYFFSCTNIRKEYYDNGQLKSKYQEKNGVLNGIYTVYYPNGKLKEKQIFFQGKNIDSSLFYYNNTINSLKREIKYLNNSDTIFVKNYFENGNLLSKGRLINDKIRVGFWYSYYSDKSLNSEIEFIKINEQEFANRIYFYNRDGKLNLDKSNFYEFRDYNTDTIKVGEGYRLDLFLAVPYFSDESEVFFTIPKKETFGKFVNLSNFNSMELDTIWNITKDKRIHKSTMSEQDNIYPNLKVYILLTFEHPGIKYLQGVLYEKAPINIDTLREGIFRKYYFEKKIVVVQ